MPKARKKLKVRLPRAEYVALANLLRSQDDSELPLGQLYAELARVISWRGKNMAEYSRVLNKVLLQAGRRVGSRSEVALRINRAGVAEFHDTEWFVRFVVHFEDRNRYNTTTVELLKIAGEALRAYYGLPEIAWTPHYQYVAPPNMGRRIPAPV